jgi:hypothetical protein
MTCDEANNLIELGLAVAQAKQQPEPERTHCAVCSDRLQPSEHDICDRHETEPMDKRWKDGNQS